MIAHPDDFPEIHRKEESPRTSPAKEKKEVVEEKSSAPATLADSSDDDEAPEPRNSESADAVYSLATENDVVQLVGEYKKRKQTQTMPSTSSVVTRKNPFNASGHLTTLRDDPSVSPEIEQQRKNSIFKVCAASFCNVSFIS